MDGSLPQIILVLVLIVFNAAFAGSEIALISLREGQLQRLEQQGAAGRRLALLARDPNRFLSTIQIGITLAGFLASATAAVSLAEPLEEPLGFLGGAAGPVSVVLVTLVIAYITLVLGELAPKRVAMQRAEGWGLAAARPISLIAVAARPFIWLLGVSTNVAVRLMGGDPSRQREEVTEEEIRDLIASQGSFTSHQRTIISEAFEIAERSMSEILRPRRQVVALQRDQPCPEGLLELAASGHSRAPVIDQDLDNIVGVVHLHQLVGPGDGVTVGEQASEAVLFPETLDALEGLRRLQVERQQLAVIINEHGGTEGIVTMEDLIEELVGEIYDESDRDIAAVRHRTDGTMVVPGGFPIHDFPDLGLEAPDGDYSTVAGLILDRLGRVPDGPGDVIELDGWRAEVLAVDRRAITEVCLTVEAPVPAAEGDDPA